MTIFPKFSTYEPPYYLLNDDFHCENKLKAIEEENLLKIFSSKLTKKLWYAPNIPTKRNGDIDGAYYNVLLEEKKWKAAELVREVLRREGKIVLVSIKNWAIWIWFSLDKFHNLITEFRHADLEHKAKWVLIIPKLRASQEVRQLLALWKVTVIETGEQIPINDSQEKQTIIGKAMNILHEKLLPILYNIFGLLLYRVYNHTKNENIRNIVISAISSQLVHHQINHLTVQWKIIYLLL